MVSEIWQRKQYLFTNIINKFLRWKNISCVLTQAVIGQLPRLCRKHGDDVTYYTS